MQQKERNKQVSEIKSDPYSTFLFGMRSPKTREKCIVRLRIFFNFIQIPNGSMESRCRVFYEKTKNDAGSEWLLSSIIRFPQILKTKFERKEITAGTVKNYYQAVKLFCEMNGISIPIS
jgi:hypothetical protein